MQVAVWDTYVQKKNGITMHFDILVSADIKDEKTIHTFGREYLRTKGEETQPLSSKECRFCHIEKASEETIKHILQNGYYIFEMENCN